VPLHLQSALPAASTCGSRGPEAPKAPAPPCEVVDAFHRRVERSRELGLRIDRGHASAAADAFCALQKFEGVWRQLFPVEQARVVLLLVRRVTVTAEELVIDIRTDGVSGVIRDMMAPRKREAAE